MLEHTRKCIKDTPYRGEVRAAERELDNLEANIKKRIDEAVQIERTANYYRRQQEVDEALTKEKERVIADALDYLMKEADVYAEALIAEYAAKEKERVIASLEAVWSGVAVGDCTNIIYPPPAPKKMPAGAYWCRRGEDEMAIHPLQEFEPRSDEYVPIPSMEKCRRIAAENAKEQRR